MEIAVNDFVFRALRRFRFFSAFNSSEYANDYYHLLTVSNEFGLIFVAQGRELKVVETNFIHENGEVTKQNVKQEVVDFPCKQISLDFDIVQVRCNCDGSILAALVHSQHGPFALFYDAKHLSPKVTMPVKPFCQYRLSSSANSKALCFEWNPTAADIFSYCCSDGSIAIVQINERKNVSILASLAPASAKPICLSWSPKGKQIVVGYDDCTFCQFKPNLQPVKKVDAVTEAVVEFIPTSIVSICWLSTTHFAVLYTASQPANSVKLCHVTINKDGPPTYVNFDDVCFGRGNSFLPRYYFTHVQEWSILMCSSTTSIETSVLGYSTEDKCWQLWNLDDAGRAELPLGQDDSSTYPVGVALDTTSQKSYIHAGQTFPPPPVLLMLSSDGLVCPFSVINMKKDAQSFCKPPQIISGQVEQKLAPSHDVPLMAAPSVKHKLSQLPAEPQLPSTVPQTVQTPRVHAVPQKHKEEEANIEDQRIQNLRQEVYRNIRSVEEDLRKLKLKLSSPMPVSMENKDLLIDLTRRINENCLTVDNLDIELNDVCEKLSDLRSGVTDAWIFAEELHLSLNRLNSREMKYFWKTRPLSAVNIRTMETFRRKIKYFEENLNQACENFDKFMVDNKSKIDQRLVNSGSLVYKTLANIQAVISQQKQRLTELHSFYSSLQSINIPKTNGRNLDVSFEQSIVKESDSVQPFTTGVNEQSRLKKFLMSRTTVPRRTTTPNLRYPTLTVKMEENNYASSPKVPIERNVSQNSITSEMMPQPVVTSSAFTAVPRSPVVRTMESLKKDIPPVKLIEQPKLPLKESITISAVTKDNAAEGFTSTPSVQQQKFDVLKQVQITKDKDSAVSTPKFSTLNIVDDKFNVPAFGGFNIPRTTAPNAMTTQQQPSTFLISMTKQQTFPPRPVPMTERKAEVTSPVITTSSIASTPIVKPVPISSSTPVPAALAFPAMKTESSRQIPLLKADPLTVASTLTKTDPLTVASLLTRAEPLTVASTLTKTDPSVVANPLIKTDPLSVATAFPKTDTSTVASPLAMAESLTVASTLTKAEPHTVENLLTKTGPPTVASPVTKADPLTVINQDIATVQKNSADMENIEMEAENPTTTQSALSSFTFVAKPTETSVGQSANIFDNTGGGGGFLSGLGGKPKAGASTTSPFGKPISFGSLTATTTAADLFAPATLFGSSTGFNTQVSPSATTNTASVFGSAATFGGFASFANTSPPAAGGSTAFGTKATFGGGSTFSSPFGTAASSPGSTFGGGFGSLSLSAPSTGGGFAAFATKETPTFGSLAGGGSPSTFGSLGGSANQPFGVTSPTNQPFGTLASGGQQSFGQLGSGASTFGSIASSPTTFGSIASGPTTFGSFGTPQQQQQPNQSSPQSSFSQWRG